ncbi:hypothetical protein [Amphiplicatus metriothermophilus]|uniref:Uncharacterized protein n=1 Tax=Amphiplicatus metriothermophilus TaxID=1519374 RepID=A0A239PPH7_9PROT|nr:hypothetical protein [Amphiplicatus metriothermophilus]MBB5518631.1 hypothetical protein [Amphiplicatus metriothermophilus]SNT72211.1 hypothetical protein SAMN06297382_1247 [Amphiplicatus metriothermophilus]
MPYGVKRGYKAPGEYGVSDLLGLSLAGAAGIIAAIVTDYQQKGEASALYTINQWVVAASRILGFGDVPLWAVVVGLIALGAGSIFYFQPITRQGAFAQGFGLLAVMMTAVPADLAGGLQAIQHEDELPGLEPVGIEREAAFRSGDARGGIVPAAYRPGEARLYFVQDRRAAERYDVHLVVRFPNGLADDINAMIRRGALRGRLHNEDTGQTYNLFRSVGGTVQREGDALVIHAGVPARAQQARLWVRIECENYAIEVQSAQARLGEQLDWTITMQPSSTPLAIQRLGKSYWF